LAARDLNPMQDDDEGVAGACRFKGAFASNLRPDTLNL
jgi:hypothetical protein